jgi:hypothetical protein
MTHIDLTDADCRFYAAHAVHSRHGLSSPHSTFCGTLSIARVALPDDEIGLRTSRGTLEVADRLLPTLAHVRAFSAMHGVPPPARVELLAPPRTHGHRFAAMSVYVLYPSAGATSPSHFILEAGMATGESAICYPPCSVGAWQTVPAGYRPTPFSTTQQVFRGTFETDPSAPDEPGRLVVEAYRSPEDTVPVLRVTVSYEALSHEAEHKPAAHPLWLRILAGARIHAVAEARRRPVALAARWLLALLAALLPWIEAPRRKPRPVLPAEVEPARVSIL